MILLFTGVELAASFIECFVLYGIFSQLFKTKRVKQSILAALIGAVIIVALNQINIFSYLTVVIGVAYMCISSWFIYRQKAFWHFAIGCFYHLCIGCLDFLVASILLSLDNGQQIVEMILADGFPRVIFIVIMKAIWIAGYIAIKPILSRANLNKSGVVAILVISIGGEAGYIYLVRQTLNTFSDSTTIGWFFLLVILALLLFVVQFVIEIKDKKVKLDLERMRNSLLEENYQNVSGIYSRNAKLYHDINNHLNTLYQLLDSGDYEDAKDYIEKISEPVKALSKTSWTGINIVDVIINSKIEKMDQKGITYEINVEFPSNSNIDSSDICTILSNLLDNAIEATEKWVKTNVPIIITIRRIQQFLMIQIENPCASVIDDTTNLPPTTKENQEIHGWGLPSVVSAVEKYNGTFNYSSANGMFTVTAILFFEEKE